MLILQILGMITQFERALIIERIKVGAGGRTDTGQGRRATLPCAPATQP
jgi:DNA invertase Pin-like site-specific DNA recombinase